MTLSIASRLFPRTDAVCVHSNVSSTAVAIPPRSCMICAVALLRQRNVSKQAYAQHAELSHTFRRRRKKCCGAFLFCAASDFGGVSFFAAGEKIFYPW